jgi:hypothetical protein
MARKRPTPPPSPGLNLSRTPTLFPSVGLTTRPSSLPRKSYRGPRPFHRSPFTTAHQAGGTSLGLPRTTHL